MIEILLLLNFLRVSKGVNFKMIKTCAIGDGVWIKIMNLERAVIVLYRSLSEDVLTTTPSRRQ